MNPNQVGILTNLPTNNLNGVYSQFPVYRNVPYQMNNVVGPVVYPNVPFPLKSLKKAYIVQRLQAATGQVN